MADAISRGKQWGQSPATRNRTRDHLITADVYSQMLYQLSYSRCCLSFPCFAEYIRFPFDLVIAAAAFNMDTLGIEPRASRMLSGCDATTPCALLMSFGCLPAP